MFPVNVKLPLWKQPLVLVFYLMRINYNLVLLFVLLCSQINVSAQTPCENGYAGPYPCDNIDLIAHVTTADIDGSTTNEVWGWTDALDSTEYVILGASTGVYFFDISNPISPVKLGKLPTHSFNSTWRTFRIYQNYLFVCSEASNHGMQVFDLTRLRNVASPPEIFTEDAHYSGFSNCHTLAICEETGYAYACGTNTYAGGLHIVNIQNPLVPVIAGGYDLNGYTHESLVMVYNGPDEDYTGHTVAFCFNGQVELPVTIVDVTDPTDASTISLSTYPDKRYCHQGWLTEDGGYMLIDDELDEYYGFVDSLHTIIFDVHDLDNPAYMGFHVGGTTIDHNQIVKGNLVFQSNYTNGLDVLDVSEIADTILSPVAYFDHFPNNDNKVFQGEWMSYPFFESGIIPVTDIYNGMFLLQPDLMKISGSATSCSHDPLSLALFVEQGFQGPYSLTVDGLPPGASFEFSPPSGEGEFGTITLTGLDALSGLHTFQFTVEGSYFDFEEDWSVDLETPSVWYADADADGFGIATDSLLSCLPPIGYVDQPGDCDPADPGIYPGAPGTADCIDNNCNGDIDGWENPDCFDLDGDHVITTNDVQIFMGNFNCSGSDCLADFNQSGSTDITDLIMLISDFGETCP